MKPLEMLTPSRSARKNVIYRTSALRKVDQALCNQLKSALGSTPSRPTFDLINSVYPSKFMTRRPTPQVPAHGQATAGLASLPREPRSPSAERWIIAGWVLILLKCTALWWAIIAFHVPIHPMWLVGPTLAFAALATALYIWRD
jgi:hypothetical protein